MSRNLCRGLRLFSTSLQRLQGSNVDTAAELAKAALSSAEQTKIKSAPAAKRSWKDQTSASSLRQTSTLKASSFLKTMEERKAADAMIVQDRNVIDRSFVPTFLANSTYDPFDFSMAKMRLDKNRARRMIKRDQFADRKVNPLSLWKDDQALSEFVTSNGRILPGHITGLRGKTQKRLAKAIRRCRAAGLLSTVHQSVGYLPDEQHPRVLRS